MDQHEAIEQLTWYFHSAESECGNRTPLGTHLDMQRTGVSFSSSRPDAELGAAARLDRMRQQASDGGDTWLRTVPRRLGSIPAGHRAALIAAYKDVLTLAESDVSVTLACLTRTARKGHEASIAAAKARLSELGGAAQRRVWSLASQSCREWLDWLTNGAVGATEDSPRAKLLEDILTEARELRQAALEAYCQDTEGAVAA
jgi:hypothetical protein